MPVDGQEKQKNAPDLLTRIREWTLPLAAIAWVIVAAVIFVFGQQTITLRDQQRFPNDFALVQVETDDPDSVRLDIRGGTYFYQVDPRAPADVPTGTFGPETENVVAARLFSNVPNVTEVTIEEQAIRITYDNPNIEADVLLRRANRPVTNAVLAPAEAITSRVGDDGALIFETDERLRYLEYVPNLPVEGEQEVYESREAMEDGSLLAQHLVNQVRSLRSATLAPDHLLITYREGANQQRVTDDVTNALNDFFPRASLQPALWLFTVSPSEQRVLNIAPFETEVPLWGFALGFALVELAIFFLVRAGSARGQLAQALVRVVGVFLLFWSIYGHEPIWDYMLGILFPTARQLVHPSGTVIEFTAQHLELVFVSSLITIPTGLLFGIIVTRERFSDLLPLVNNLVNSGQTIPTIAIVAFMAPLIGFGFWPAIIALIAYGLLPVVRNTIAGLNSVSDFIIDSARGMGMTPLQILWQIELPIASSVIIAGIRTSMVINVGTATLGAFVGSGGLGTPITSGLSMTVDAFIVLGAIPAALLAILIDFVLAQIELVVTPRGLQIEQ